MNAFENLSGAFEDLVNQYLIPIKFFIRREKKCHILVLIQYSFGFFYFFIYFIFYFFLFQPMMSAPNNNSLSSDQDTNRFLALAGIEWCKWGLNEMY